MEEHHGEIMWRISDFHQRICPFWSKLLHENYIVLSDSPEVSDNLNQLSPNFTGWCRLVHWFYRELIRKNMLNWWNGNLKMDSTDLGNLSYQIRNCVNNRDKKEPNKGKPWRKMQPNMAMTWMNHSDDGDINGYDTVWSMVKRLFVGKHLTGNYGFYMFFFM